MANSTVFGFQFLGCMLVFFVAAVLWETWRKKAKSK